MLQSAVQQTRAVAGKAGLQLQKVTQESAESSDPLLQDTVNPPGPRKMCAKGPKHPCYGRWPGESRMTGTVSLYMVTPLDHINFTGNDAISPTLERRTRTCKTRASCLKEQCTARMCILT